MGAVARFAAVAAALPGALQTQGRSAAFSARRAAVPAGAARCPSATGGQRTRICSDSPAGRTALIQAGASGE